MRLQGRAGARLCVLLGGATVALACGAMPEGTPAADGARDAAGAVAAGLQLPDEPGPGCGDAAVTDHENIRADRTVARCAPGSPAPQPLEERQTLRVGIQRPTEALAPLLLADELGELERENLVVELVEIPDLRDAYQALIEGEIDAVAGGLHGAFFDAADDGTGVRVVMGGGIPSAGGNPSVPQAGLWVRNGALGGPDRWRDLEGEPLVIPNGPSASTAYPLAHVFLRGDASVNDFRVLEVGGQAAADRLLFDEAPFGWIEDPYWQAVADSGRFRLAGPQPSESLRGVVLSERLLAPDTGRKVGLAFVRAMVRTINTYLGESYRDNPEVRAALLDTTGWTDRQLNRIPPLIFDWEVRPATVESIQIAMVPLGAVLFEEAYEGPEVEEMFIDTSLYRDAVSE